MNEREQARKDLEQLSYDWSWPDKVVVMIGVLESLQSEVDHDSVAIYGKEKSDRVGAYCRYLGRELELMKQRPLTLSTYATERI